MLVNKTFEMNAAERAALTDAEILDMAYGIENYSPWDDEVSAAEKEQRVDILRELQPRLRALQAARKAARATRAGPQLVLCSCGHTVPAAQVMAASHGTSCPGCDDRLAD